MKKDLLIGGAFVALATLGISIVGILGSQPEQSSPKTIKPKPEPVASIAEKSVKEKVPKPIQSARKIPIQLTRLQRTKPTAEVIEKKVEPVKKNAEPERASEDEVKKEDKPNSPIQALPSKTIVLGNITKLDDPNGEWTVKCLKNDDEIILLGKIKSLKLHGAHGKSVLDTSELEAREILFIGDILGESQVKLYAPGGTMTFQGVVQGNSQLEVIAPDGKVIFKNANPKIVSGNPKVDIVAKRVELLGAIDGSSFITVALTKGGSLKFTQLLKGARLHYGKANSGDPSPRIEKGIVNPGAELHKVDLAKKRD